MAPARILGLLIAFTGLSDMSAHAGETQTTLSVVFEESAPKDIFTITNTGQCSVKALQLQIDLSSSESGLIFDPTGAGAGVNVFQPLEIESGRHLISSFSNVRDGDQKVTFVLKELKPGSALSFTTDVDDTLKQSERGQTMISGGEIQGASVNVQFDKGERRTATFSSKAMASIYSVPCA